MKRIFAEKFFSNERNNVLLVSVIAAAVILPIFFYGVPTGYDLPHHYQCALTYRDSILEGDFYPSWTNLRNFGYGSMELRLYPPASHYVLALFSLLTGEWFYATWLTFSFWWILGSLGVYLWAREMFSPQAAVAAAIVYAIMPYRLNQVYLVFFYGELAGAAVLPFCFAFLARMLREQEVPKNLHFGQKKKQIFSLNVFGLAASYALLVLTHLPLTLIVSIALTVYFLTMLKLDWKACLFEIVRFTISIGVGLAASSFFWLKVLQERVLLAKTLVYADVFLDYRLNFLFTIFQQHDGAAEAIYEGFTLVYDIVLLTTLITTIPIALLVVFGKLKLNRQLKALWATFLFALFLTTPGSRFLWDNFPLLQEVQFPWRWLTIISLFAPLLFAAAFPIFIDYFADKKLRPLALILLGTFAVGGFFGVNQTIRGALYKDHTELRTFIEGIGRQEGFTFWWTRFARKEIFENLEKVSSANREVEIEDWRPTDRTFQVSEGDSAFVRIATFYHPNWRAAVNKIETEIRATDDGAMLIAVPVQSSIVRLEFRETFTVQVGRWLSSFAWLLMFLFGIQKLIAKKN